MSAPPPCRGWDLDGCCRSAAEPDREGRRKHLRAATVQQLIADLASNGGGGRFVMQDGELRLKTGPTAAPCGLLVDALRERRDEVVDHLGAAIARGAGWGGEDLPIALAYTFNAFDDRLAVWCPRCRTYHIYSYSYDRGWPENRVDLIRVSQCPALSLPPGGGTQIRASDPPYAVYVLRLAGSLVASHQGNPALSSPPEGDPDACPA